MAAGDAPSAQPAGLKVNDPKVDDPGKSTARKSMMPRSMAPENGEGLPGDADILGPVTSPAPERPTLASFWSELPRDGIKLPAAELSRG